MSAKYTALDGGEVLVELNGKAAIITPNAKEIVGFGVYTVKYGYTEPKRKHYWHYYQSKYFEGKNGILAFETLEQAECFAEKRLSGSPNSLKSDYNIACNLADEMAKTKTAAYTCDTCRRKSMGELGMVCLGHRERLDTERHNPDGKCRLWKPYRGKKRSRFLEY